MQYSFRTPEYKGTVELREQTVLAVIHYRGNKWERETPYQDISPFPTKTEATPSWVWISAIIGLVAVLGGVLGYWDGSTSIIYSVGLGAAGIAMIAFAWYFRRETWISYSTATRGNRICFARNGPMADEFASFCEEFDKRLRRDSENGRTTE